MTRFTLATEGLCFNFGGLQVTDNVSFRLESGARHALIGPNGAGKSTFINLLTGMLTPMRGTIFLEDSDITHLPAERRVHRGLARTFQINTLFPQLSPLDATTLTICQRRGLGAKLFRRVADCTEAIAEAEALLGQLGLADECRYPTCELSYGRQRLLEIALALASRPRVLLLDEPAAGVPMRESAELFQAIAALPRDMAILFIEHDMELVFRFAERITVMVGGKILCEGPPGEIAASPEVRTVYLGEDDDG
jgi:branched-chain amino acid transport system ATP-binding protein